jgi:hypothetical protein
MRFALLSLMIMVRQFPYICDPETRPPIKVADKLRTKPTATYLSLDTGSNQVLLGPQ